MLPAKFNNNLKFLCGPKYPRNYNALQFGIHWSFFRTCVTLVWWEITLGGSGMSIKPPTVILQGPALPSNPAPLLAPAHTHSLSSNSCVLLFHHKLMISFLSPLRKQSHSTTAPHTSPHQFLVSQRPPARSSFLLLGMKWPLPEFSTLHSRTSLQKFLSCPWALCFSFSSLLSFSFAALRTKPKVLYHWATSSALFETRSCKLPRLASSFWSSCLSLLNS